MPICGCGDGALMEFNEKLKNYLAPKGTIVQAIWNLACEIIWWKRGQEMTGVKEHMSEGKGVGSAANGSH